jgi:cytochrome P450 family 4
MGTRLGEGIADEGPTYKNAIYALGKNLAKRTTRILLYSDFLFNFSSLGRQQQSHVKIVRNFTKKVIKERKQYIELNGPEFITSEETNDDESLHMGTKRKRPAMLDLLLLAQKENLIDDSGIQEEVDTFMFEVRFGSYL